MTTTTFNLDSVKDVLSDYFGLSLPDNILNTIVSNSPKLQDEIRHNSLSDTCARDELIDVVCRHLQISVNERDMFGAVGASHWPMFGDPEAYKNAFYAQLAEKVGLVGGAAE